MPHLRAFRALRYDPLAVSDAGAVLCPPYDVIEPEMRQALAARHPRNAVHVELPAGIDEGRYERAARMFAEWRRDGTLQRDATPGVYPYEQRYSLAGGRRSARGFFCLLRLEEFRPGSGVRPHERTMGGPKEDRFRLLSATGVNLSAVMMLYQTDAAGRPSAELLDVLTAPAPDFEGTDHRGARHRLWRAPAESAAASSLLEFAAAQPLTIADGHHRYETARRYRDERPTAGGHGGDGADYVLVLLMDAASGGLTVLPTHRVLRTTPGLRLDAPGGAERLFRLEARHNFEGLAAEVEASGRIGLWTPHGGALLAVDRSAVAPLLPSGVSDALRWLDVTVLDAALEVLAGAPAAELVASGMLSYTKSAADAAERVADGTASAAFLLPPTPIRTVLETAAAGELMPQKSTYFEPKPATGLVFNPVAE